MQQPSSVSHWCGAGWSVEACASYVRACAPSVEECQGRCVYVLQCPPFGRSASDRHKTYFAPGVGDVMCCYPGLLEAPAV